MARERKPQKPGYGFMFPVKERRENGPNVVGRLRLDQATLDAVNRGEEIEVSAWTKTAASGARYMSLKVATVRGDAMAQPTQMATAVQPTAQTAGGDEDIPF